MSFFQRVVHLLSISKSHGILRRYFIVNGFDGALTMLGLILGFELSDHTDVNIALNACLAAAIALSVSGISSAYVSESSERQRALKSLQHSMLSDLRESHHAQASEVVPWIVALVNGVSPLCMSLLILSPLWMASKGIALMYSPYWLAISIAALLMFLLGVYLGQIAGHSWIKSGARTLLFGLLTMYLIYVFTGN